MKIVNIARADTGGQTERLSRAINTVFKGKYSSRAFTHTLNYINYPTDIFYDKKWGHGFPKQIVKIWHEADVYHLHHKITSGRVWRLRRRPDAGIIMHLHGRPNYKRTPELLAEGDRRNKILRVVSTPALLPLVSNQLHRWFPAPMDFKLIRRLRKENKKDDGIFRVVHAPTRRKNTDEFLKVMKLIKQKYSHVETVLVRRKTHANCLRMKAVGDIYFDSLRGGPGSNGFESMVMGMPVIAGCNDNIHPFVKGKWTIEAYKKLGKNVPFITATPNTLFEVIEELILNDSLRKSLIKYGALHVNKYHTFKYTAEHAIKTYQEAIDMRN